MVARSVSIALIPLLASLSAASAADMPKEGTDSYTTSYVVTAAHVMKLGDRSYTSLDFVGISRNDAGRSMFNNMGVHCMGSRDATPTEIVSRGTCIDMDKDGDQVFTTYESRGAPGATLTGAHTFVGGTGKYTGISGKAEYTVQPVKAPDATVMFVVPHKAVWTLQPAKE